MTSFSLTGALFLRLMRYIRSECIDDYITEDNSVRVIEAFVDSLNIVELGFKNSCPTNLYVSCLAPFITG